MSYSDIRHNLSGDLDVKTLRVLNIHHELRIWIQTGAKITIKDYFITATGVRQAREFWRRGEYSGTHFAVPTLFSSSSVSAILLLYCTEIKPDNAFSMGAPPLTYQCQFCAHIMGMTVGKSHPLFVFHEYSTSFPMLHPSFYDDQPRSFLLLQPSPDRCSTPLSWYSTPLSSTLFNQLNFGCWLSTEFFHTFS